MTHHYIILVLMAATYTLAIFINRCGCPMKYGVVSVFNPLRIFEKLGADRARTILGPTRDDHRGVTLTQIGVRLNPGHVEVS
mmetsp:Transcript_21945/g.45701  ORF Transcript_21945/g.45701 Transcript_21945/m.45701 type:complete len:82 (-) Transcript_21945:122-367(-)|eukprot:CAMPEP_0182526390 /NCGR_PEP_ID=MMETSP1323-20130603/3149_1 /TAXON_ID=236787 /ORGANISM="Florenciella parvula, Strain RCC1693" /LENGTH=81 /DNA_ID=CAMNT_0024735239 /DNA_START=592 /DNA_END=837 /DNA_ORIENTATION=-